MASLIPVQPWSLPTWWPLLKPRLARACEYVDGRFDAADAMARVMAGEWQMWVGFDERPKGMLVTELRQWPKCRTLEIILLEADDMQTWWPYLPALEEYARARGCAAVEMTGRLGWKRALQERGWTVGHVVGRKALNG